MKTKTAKRKSKSEPVKDPSEKLPFGMQPTREIDKKPERDEGLETFTEMETGQPDKDDVPDKRNPAAAQGGQGPLNLEGEGDRQNDQLAELEELEPDFGPKDENK